MAKYRPIAKLAAELDGVSVADLRRAIRAGELPGRRVGYSFEVLERDVRAWLRKQREAQDG